MGRPARSVPHVLLMLYALPGRLAGFEQRDRGAVRAPASSGSRCLATSDLDGIEPFGFVDGISQPRVDWERDAAGAATRNVRTTRTCAAWANTCSAIRTNTAATPTGRCSTPALDRRCACRAPRTRPIAADLGRNGSYLVLRQLRQDVHGFWQLRRSRRPAATPPCASGSRSAWSAARATASRWSARPTRRSKASGDAGDLNAFTYRSRPATACAARSARTSGAAIRATPICRRARPASSRGAMRTLGFDADALATISSRRPAFIACCAAGANTASPCRRRRRSPSRRERRTGPALHLPRRQHRAPVRVRAERLGRRHPLRRPAERKRSAPRHAPAGADGTPDRRLLDARAPTAPTSASPACRSSSPCVGGAYFFLPGIRALRFLATAQRPRATP